MSTPKPWPPECSEPKSNHFTLKERRATSELRIKNPRKRFVTLVRVDGGAITGDAVRCDYLVVGDNPSFELFVELKGSDFEHACKQLKNSMRRLSGKSCKKRDCFVVATSIPSGSQVLRKKLKNEFRDKHNSNLFIMNTPAQYVIS